MQATVYIYQRFQGVIDDRCDNRQLFLTGNENPATFDELNSLLKGLNLALITLVYSIHRQVFATPTEAYREIIRVQAPDKGDSMVANVFSSFPGIGQMLAVLLACMAQGLLAQEQPNEYQIISISSWDTDNTYVNEFEAGLEARLKERLGEFHLYKEYLDAGRFNAPSTRNAFADYLSQKYQAISIDAVISVSAPAEEFLDNHPALFQQSSLPVNIAAGSSYIEDNVPGQETSNDYKIMVDHVSALREILHVYPVDRVLVFGDISELASVNQLETFQNQINESVLDIDIDYLLNQPLEASLDRLGQLPPRTAIYYMPSFDGINGSQSTPAQVLGMLGEHANAPVFSHWSTSSNSILGGYQVSWERIGELAGDLIAAQLHNEQPLLDRQSIFERNYSWDQLNRWGIDTSMLAAGTNILNRPVSFLEHYRLHIILGTVGLVIIFIILAQGYRNLLIRRRNAILSELAEIDGLTTLLNRRAIMPLINDSMRRREQFEHTVSILLLDLDRFKNINDRYGHMIGDDVLANVGEALKTSVRSGDRVCRWGGEEFLILASDTGLYQAQLLGEKLRTVVESLHFDVVESISISVGVAEYKPEEGFASWYERADRALYEAKEKGRNQVIGFAA